MLLWLRLRLHLVLRRRLCTVGPLGCGDGTSAAALQEGNRSEGEVKYSGHETAREPGSNFGNVVADKVGGLSDGRGEKCEPHDGHDEVGDGFDAIREEGATAMCQRMSYDERKE